MALIFLPSIQHILETTQMCWFQMAIECDGIQILSVFMLCCYLGVELIVV